MSVAVHLPWPDPLLWPNGSEGNRHASGRAKRNAKQWAYNATLEALKGGVFAFTPPLAVKVTIYPKRFGVLPDADNCVAALKHSFDGIALGIKCNDRDFAAPTVEFGAREGRVEVTLG